MPFYLEKENHYFLKQQNVVENEILSGNLEQSGIPSCAWKSFHTLSPTSNIIVASSGFLQ